MWLNCGNEEQNDMRSSFIHMNNAHVHIILNTNVTIKIGGKYITCRLSLLLTVFSLYSSTAACAAARRAIGTRNGEQLT
jgi:hypothetical protein